jgi:amino acid transporter
MAWAEMNGFGLTKAGLTKFANSGSSVVELSDMYTNNAITILVTLAIVVSAFSTALGSMTASTRMLYELAKEHKAPAVFARVHQKHNTPYTSDHTIFVIALIPPIAMYAASHGALSGTDVFGTVATVGILGLILTYGLTCLSSVVYFTRLRDGKREWTWQVIFPIIAIAVMAYCFYGNLAGNSLAIITFIVLIAGFIVTKVYQHRSDNSAAASAKQAKAAAKNGQIM